LHDANPEPGPFDHFLDEGLIEHVIRPIKSGKEASVHLCRANPRTTGHDLLALKAYHPLNRRDFRDESMYRDGEWIKPPDLPGQHNGVDEFGAEDNLTKAVELYEKTHIERTIGKTGGDKIRAAELLGLSLSTLYRKLEKLGIDG